MTLPATKPYENDQDTIGFVNELFGEARREKRKYLDRWNRYYRAFRNRSWSEYRATWLPSPSSSEIFPSYHTIVAWMTDQRPVLFASPAPSLKDLPVPPDDKFRQVVKQKAEDMQHVLASWWVTRTVAPQIEKSLFDTLMFGAGILKTGWDQSYEDGRGDAFCRRVDPYTILPDPNASCIEDARYILEVRRVPLFEIRSRFPERGHLVRGDNAGESRADTRPNMRGNFEVIPMANPAATGVTGVFPGTPTSGIPARYGYPGFEGADDYTKTVLLVECWVRTTESYDAPYIEGGEYMGNLSYERPVWQYTAVANNVVLTPDVTNPFSHGQCPYVRVPLCEVGEFWSIPMSEHLGPAQTAMNRLLAALQSNAELAGNPIFLEDSNAQVSRTKIVARPGGRLVKSPGSEVKWLEPPNMPANTKELVQFWSDRIDRMSGIQAVAASLRRKQAAQTVDAVQEASFVRIRAILRNMEESVRIASNQVASNMAQFYIEPRCVSLIGPVGSAEDFLMLGHRHFSIPTPTPEGTTDYHPVDFDISVQAGSSLPISRQARAAEADALFRLGAIDDEALLESHDWPDRKQVIARTQQKKTAGMMPQSGHNPRAH